jgi:heme/copper-type cytochrome/quinol oxidase subunit 3
MAQPLLDEAIRWSRYGMQCFLGNALLFAIYFIINLLMTGISYSPNEPSMTNATFIMPYVIISLILALSAQKTVIEPLKSNNLDGMREKMIIHGILGIFFGLVIGIFPFFWADEKIKAMKSR